MTRAAWVAVVVLTGCSCRSDVIPETETLIVEGRQVRGQRRFVAEGSQFYLYTTTVTDEGFAHVQEETDYRKYFSVDSPVVVRTRTKSSWEALGAGNELFVLSSGDDGHYAEAGYWRAGGRAEIVRCGQGIFLSVDGEASHPLIHVDGRQCALGCELASPGRDGAWFIGSRETQTFTMSCAKDYLKPRRVVPSKTRFVFQGQDFVRVEELRPGEGMVTIAERPTPEGIEEVLGVFEEDLSILATRGRMADQEIVEFDARDGGVVPSRFGLPLGFTVKQVYRPTPDATFAYGWGWDTSELTLKRSEREGGWSRSFTTRRAHVELAVGASGAVLLQVEPLDGGTSDVWIQRFSY